MIAGTDMLEVMAVPAYTTDPAGRITFFNDAAAAFWGRRPELGVDRWSGALRLYQPDGRLLRHESSPLARTLNGGEPGQGMEAIMERPDGSRVTFKEYPGLLRDASGEVAGAVNLMIDVSAAADADISAARLAAIVSSSDDAIISKTLEGRITSWNAGARRIFGYEAEEIIGQPILRIIPPELHGEESEILLKLKRGERIEHYDTVRVTKDGRRVDISLTVSPVRDARGKVVGASKVARDVSDRKRSEALQRLLFQELNHRVKNTLAMVASLAQQSLRTAASADDFTESFTGRVQALARAHDLLVLGNMQGTDLTDIVREQVLLGGDDGLRVSYHGPRLMLESQRAVQMSLVLHELATNARKYGALSVPAGRLTITWKVVGRELRLTWRESGVVNLTRPRSSGFGTTLIERTLEAYDGSAAIEYRAGGIACELRLELPQGAYPPAIQDDRGPQEPSRAPARAGRSLLGKRVLVVEDEAIIAMDLQARLRSFGCEVVGPAATAAKAVGLIDGAELDLALLDANLGGEPVDDIAAALRERAVPFIFVTGYGRDGLPAAHREAPVLSKPFNSTTLLRALELLLQGGR